MITRHGWGHPFDQLSLGNEDRSDSEFDAFVDGEGLWLNAKVW